MTEWRSTSGPAASESVQLGRWVREPLVTAVPVAFMRSPCAQSKAEGPPAVNRLECTAVRLCSFSRCSSDSSVYMRAAEVNSVSPPLASGERHSSAVCEGPTLSCKTSF